MVGVIMDIINQLLDTVKESQNPEMYYLAIAMVFALLFYIISKFIKMMIIFAVLVSVIIAFSLYKSGGDVGAMLEYMLNAADTIIAKIIDLFTNPDSSIREVFSDLISRFSGETVDEKQ